MSKKSKQIEYLDTMINDIIFSKLFPQDPASREIDNEVWYSLEDIVGGIFGEEAQKIFNKEQDDVMMQEPFGEDVLYRKFLIDTLIKCKTEVMKTWEGDPPHVIREKKSKQYAKVAKTIFVGHGENKDWARIVLFLKETYKFNIQYFEKEDRNNESISQVLKAFVDSCGLAIMLLSGEDETKDGRVRAPQNVIHEAGLFQGMLGFENVLLLVDRGIEGFINMAGMQIIYYDKNVESSFTEIKNFIERYLKKHYVPDIYNK
jgi:predicted nucleotide-binding protein